jgi:hypothetical protein
LEAVTSLDGLSTNREKFNWFYFLQFTVNYEIPNEVKKTGIGVQV